MEYLPEVKGEDSVHQDTATVVLGNFPDTNRLDAEDSKHHLEKALNNVSGESADTKPLDVEDVATFLNEVHGKSSDANPLDAEIAEHSVEKDLNVHGDSLDTKSLDAKDIGPSIASSPDQVRGKSSVAKTLDAVIAEHSVGTVLDDVYGEPPDTRPLDAEHVKHSGATLNLDHLKSSVSNPFGAEIAEHSVETASNQILGKSMDTKPLDAEITKKPLDAEITEHFVVTDLEDIKPLDVVIADETTLNQVHGNSADSNPLDAENPALSIETASKQLVIYSPPAANTCRDIIDLPGSAENSTSSSRRPLFRGLPSIGAFTVQCANCFKWRLIPTKEKYEEIRETILQNPFLCERAHEWRPEVSCEDPTDISQDGSRLWAIDKPNIAQPPPGWERLLRIRGEGGTRFADVYYVAPCGKKLRSMVEVERYLCEHPQYISTGVKLSQFSFQTPRPLSENYVRKRPVRPLNLSSSGNFGSQTGSNEVNPISWVPPTNLDLQIGSPGLSAPLFDPSSNHRHFEQPSETKRRKKAMPYSNRMYRSSIFEQPKVEAEDYQGGGNGRYDP